MRELFRTVLANGGYRPLPAADGEEALEIMEREYIERNIAWMSRFVNASSPWSANGQRRKLSWT